jgi:hypothetical protein
MAIKHIIVLFVETPRKFITAVINLRGVSTNKTIIVNNNWTFAYFTTNRTLEERAQRLFYTKGMAHVYEYFCTFYDTMSVCRSHKNACQCVFDLCCWGSIPTISSCPNIISPQWLTRIQNGRRWSEERKHIKLLVKQTVYKDFMEENQPQKVNLSL